MKEKNGNMNLKGLQQDKQKKEKDLPGYPSYPPDEDIYNKDKEEKEINPENIIETKALNDDLSGGDLDVPGSELDDQQEAIGSEDEENNYYSLGGDDHSNLDENNEK